MALRHNTWAKVGMPQRNTGLVRSRGECWTGGFIGGGAGVSEETLRVSQQVDYCYDSSQQAGDASVSTPRHRSRSKPAQVNKP